MLDWSFLSELYFSVDAPPIPRLVDLVHAFKGVVVEQFKKRVDSLAINKATFQNSTVPLLGGLISVLIHSSTLFVNISGIPSYSPFCYSLVFSPMENDEDNTPQQQQEEGDADTGGKKKCSSKSDSLFPLSDSSRKAQRRQSSMQVV